MANANRVTLIGNLTRDPDIKNTAKGTAIVSITLAINSAYISDSGEKKESTTYVDIDFWARVGEIVAKYAKKGSSLYIEGHLKLDSWEDKDSGQKRSKLKVVGDNIQLLSPRTGENTSYSPPEQQKKEQAEIPF